VWQPYSNSHDKSLVNWGGELWADLAVVPSLVQELALLQLRSLLGVDSQDSSELVEVAVALPELLPEDDEERP